MFHSCSLFKCVHKRWFPVNFFSLFFAFFCPFLAMPSTHHFHNAKCSNICAELMCYIPAVCLRACRAPAPTSSFHPHPFMCTLMCAREWGHFFFERGPSRDSSKYTVLRFCATRNFLFFPLPCVFPHMSFAHIAHMAHTRLKGTRLSCTHTLHNRCIYVCPRSVITTLRCSTILPCASVTRWEDSERMKRTERMKRFKRMKRIERMKITWAGTCMEVRRCKCAPPHGRASTADLCSMRIFPLFLVRIHVSCKCAPQFRTSARWEAMPLAES